MRIGYDDEYSEWGKGLPVKIGITVYWDSLSFWRIVPHKHIPESHRSMWPEEMIVNQRCDKCLRWFVKATGELNKELNRLEK